MKNQENSNLPARHNVQPIIKFTETRMKNTARLTSRFCLVFRDYYGRMETERENLLLSMLAEETALLMPEDAEINDINRMGTEEILCYIEEKNALEAGIRPPREWEEGDRSMLWRCLGFITLIGLVVYALKLGGLL